MPHNHIMESQPVDMGEVYWCPLLEKYLLISGIDLNDRAIYLGQEYDILEDDVVESPGPFIYHGVEKTQLWPIADWHGMRDKVKKFLLERSKRADASPDE